MTSTGNFWQNCYRRNLHREDGRFSRVAWNKVHNKTSKIYCNFRGKKFYHGIFLCTQCKTYLEKKKNEEEDYWPAMLWAFLSASPGDNLSLKISLQVKWTIIPNKWRHWWIQPVHKIDPCITLHYPPAVFEDVSLEYDQLTSTVHNLEWQTLADAIDDYMTTPSVRCPMGCSEFLSECNRLPFEDFLSHFSNGAMPSYSKGKHELIWTDVMKPGWPKSCILLENEDFVCRPSLYVGDGKISILCCTNHSTSSKKKWFTSLLVPPVLYTPTSQTSSHPVP